MKSVQKPFDSHYAELLVEVSGLLDDARRIAARSINSVMTATYWELGRRIVQFEQRGKKRAGYGEALLAQLARDLTARMGRGFSVTNLQNFRGFFLAWPIHQTVSVESGRAKTRPTASGGSRLVEIAASFRLSWSHYVRLLAVSDPAARHFYETEALRGGWSVRQLDRQISTIFFERMALSRDSVGMLAKGGRARKEDRMNAEEEIRDPLVLEFLNLKDEYSESELEEALLQHLEHFLLELGGNFAFVGRQRRLRIGDEWYRLDLLFFHRKLRCLIVIDLKIGRFTHADAGQMQVYLNYAKRHWTNEGENPPVGLILCSQPNDALAEYALAGLPNTILAREYKSHLPEATLLAGEIEKTRHRLEKLRRTHPKS